jgi:hypothetical protein
VRSATQAGATVQWLPPLHPQVVTTPVQVLVMVPQVLGAHTALLRQQVPLEAPDTTGPGSGETQTSLPAQAQVRLEPSPFGKVGLAPLEQGRPTPPSAPRLVQVS